MDSKYDWLVYSTSSFDHSLLVICRKTGELGYVPNPTIDEWTTAFHAPSNPYSWHDSGRVVIDPNTAPPFDRDTMLAAMERSHP